MKAKQVSKNTVVLIDGNYQYQITRQGDGEDAFSVKKARVEYGGRKGQESEDVFDFLLGNEGAEEEEE
jgi:FKBP-type peptidyl-prolyl cis-trans isomerase